MNQDTEQIDIIKAEIESLKDLLSELETSNQDQLSIAVVSGDMDKILATMVIALAAAAMDTKVKLFFSFWALSALRDPKKGNPQKAFLPKMFGLMLPKGKNKLKLSKLNMAGIGPKIIRSLMKKQGVLSLDAMFQQAKELEIEIIVCEMSMNLMGFKKEELIDYPYLSYAGAATFVSEASASSSQLLI